MRRPAIWNIETSSSKSSVPLPSKSNFVKSSCSSSSCFFSSNVAVYLLFAYVAFLLNHCVNLWLFNGFYSNVLPSAARWPGYSLHHRRKMFKKNVTILMIRSGSNEFMMFDLLISYGLLSLGNWHDIIYYCTIEVFKKLNYAKAHLLVTSLCKLFIYWRRL